MNKNKKIKNKNIAVLFSAVAFPLIWWMLVIIGSSVILASANKKYVLFDIYHQNLQIIFTVYLIASFFLILFGIWFAEKFYESK